MQRNWSVEFRILVDVDVDGMGNADEVWEEAVDILRAGGGDITGHTIFCDDEIMEDMP